MTNDLPEKFVRLITESHGEKGEKWLAGLPALTREIERNWSLKIKGVFSNLSYHFVAPCVLENEKTAVLKIGFPEENSPIFNEAEMLKLYGGRGAVKFLKLDENRLALLLEKLEAGKHLKDVFQNDEAKSIEIAAEILRKIKRKPPENHNFVFLEDWFRGFEKASDTDFPAEPIKKARRFYEDLSNGETFLIHGDFHHENILSAGGQSFLAIDPKGVIGQIGYEIGVFLNNHVWWLKDDARLHEEINGAARKFAEAFDVEILDLKKWAYAQAVLSAWWTFEENGKNWKTDLALADVWEV